MEDLSDITLLLASTVVRTRIQYKPKSYQNDHALQLLCGQSIAREER